MTTDSSHATTVAPAFSDAGPDRPAPRDAATAPPATAAETAAGTGTDAVDHTAVDHPARDEMD